MFVDNFPGDASAFTTLAGNTQLVADLAQTLGTCVDCIADGAVGNTFTQANVHGLEALFNGSLIG